MGDAERDAANDAARLMLIVGSVTMLGAAAAAWILAGRILRPLRDVADTTRMISDTDLSLRVPSRGKDDELDRLVATINGMLDRVEAGVSAQRRFIDDAGHELRTPITIVRGHLEVLDPADPQDVASTVTLVNDELGRMNRMVSDLLLLAQSEQPSFLHPEVVDVEALTQEAFSKISRPRSVTSNWRRSRGRRRCWIRSGSRRRWWRWPTTRLASPRRAAGSE